MWHDKKTARGFVTTSANGPTQMTLMIGGDAVLDNKTIQKNLFIIDEALLT